MKDDRWRVFLDTNVFITGLVSRTGASAAILDLGEAEEIRIVVSQQILVEADRVFLSKFPHLIDQFRMFFKNLAPLLIDDPSPVNVQKVADVIHPDDAAILAAAQQQPIDYLITLDKKHFHTAKVRAVLSAAIVTPAEFLKEFRKFWEKY